MRFLATITFCVSLVLTGCSLSPTAGPTASSGATIQGRVHGGPQPVVGAAVYLYAANTGGYGGNGLAASTGNASVSLLTSSVLTNNIAQSGVDANGHYYVLTDATGSFTISSDYTCTPGQQVYLYAIGGNPGSGINSAAAFLAVLGACPAAGNFATTTPYVWMNEVSTIAAAYAFSGFATDATHVSSSGTALAQTGIANAFLNASSLVSTSTGGALATTPAVNGGNGTVPQSTINTLANILAACISSTGPSSSACSTLFANDTSNGIPTGASGAGVEPTDTATAAINLAHYPYTASVSTIFSIASGTAAPYQPALGTAPGAFTIALNFTAHSLSFGNGIAIDGSGNAWIVGANGVHVTKLSSTGAALSGSGGGYTGGGLSNPIAIAIDASGNAWIANEFANSVTKLSNSGAVLSGSGSGAYTGGGLNEPYHVAIDGLGNAWVANYGANKVTELSNTGSILSGSGYPGSGVNGAASIAVDGSGNAWIGNYGGNSVTEFSSTGTVLSSSGAYTGGGLNEPESIAIDSAGNAWTANYGGNSVTELSNTGTVLSDSGNGAYTGGGLNQPYAIAIDGSGNAWIADYGANKLTELSNTGVVLSGGGYSGGGLALPSSIALDGSGNAWVANGGSVTEFIGAATPVITPICAGLPATPTADGTSNLGTRP